MGLRDRILNKVKRVLGGGGSAPARSSPSPTPRAAAPDAAPAPAAPTPPAAASAPAAGEAGKERAEDYIPFMASSAIAEGSARTGLAPNGRTVAVFRYQGKLFCIDNECRHEDGPVGEGEIKGKVVKCPYHDWAYDFTTGQCVSNPENKLETYYVKEVDGQVYVGGVATPGTSMRGGEHNDGLKVIVR